MRGVPFVQVPTTLTAQVDAAIGGKTAVNLPEGKNLVGTFSQPRACSPTSSRSRRSPSATSGRDSPRWRSTRLTLDLELLDDPGIRPGAGAPPRPRRRSRRSSRGACAAKARTVADDERDTGARLFLNYGHTLGHALERLDAFAGRTHGEAIAIGMVFAARLAEARGLAALGAGGADRPAAQLARPRADGALPPAGDLLAAFRMDKKFHGGVRFVLLRDVGEPVVVDDVSEAELRATMREMGASG